MSLLSNPSVPAWIAQVQAQSLGSALPTWSVVPFALLLVCIAVLPLCAHHWWEKNANKALVGAVLAGPFALWLLWAYGERAEHPLLEAVLDYVSFLTLLFALYVISGGIYIRGSLAGSPLSNAGLLGIGAVLANLIGTTGASMVLIRPLLRANAKRKRRAHLVVFFIFVVSNTGGLLTPFADPPLYLGFLKGVPFAWTLSLWKEWVVVNVIVLLAFVLVDSFVLDKEELERPGAQLEDVLKHERFGVEGLWNVLFLAGIVAVILGKGYGIGTGGAAWPFGVQEGLMLGLAAAAYMTTRSATRAANKFTLGPIIEVAVLFSAIFITMVAPLQLLNARGAELGLAHAWQYFWATGSLSSFLDNAPTYLTFAAVACGGAGIPVEGSHYLRDFLASGGDSAAILAAISCGAVMMGAMTYIGNGPNFMVKAIAEENGVKMPSFFGYMAWSCLILLPVFVIVTRLFFV